MKTMRYFTILLLCGVLSWTSPANAQGKRYTPSQVYQVLDNVINELDQFHKANSSMAPNEEIEITGRLPRHVIQKARLARTRIIQLKALKGITAKDLEPFPVKAVAPADVYQVVSELYNEVIELRGVYGTGPAAKANLSSGKNPNDVYIHLDLLINSINALGLPAIVPNDVYRSAETVSRDIDPLLLQFGLKTTQRRHSYTGKKPKDVYALAYKTQDIISEIARLKNYRIRGGFPKIPLKEIGVTPHNVLEMQINLLADIGALKNAADAREPSVLAYELTGKTPSDVYTMTEMAYGKLVRLRDHLTKKY